MLMPYHTTPCYTIQCILCYMLAICSEKLEKIEDKKMEYKGQTNDNKNGLKNILCTDGKLIEFRELEQERKLFALNTS